jgi:predicted ATPase/class 3 adenylate cyclase
MTASSRAPWGRVDGWCNVVVAICPNCGEDNPERFAFCGVCGTRLAEQPPQPQEARKTVTVVFCDLVGSTALGERLDSESLREMMDRYFTEMKRILERHGGIVEKYIGDAIMAIFGLPRAHEDDALRAVRATAEMGVALERLNTELERDWGVRLANRTGVNTGEVVVGDPSSGQRLATGDAVNVAARLEQAAPPGCVLVGEPTYRLVKDAADVEAVDPLALKGKSDRLPAFRLVEVRPRAEGIRRRLDAPLVGRSEELARLLDAFEAVAQEKRCHLVTVLGEAGVGKSRLVAELAERLRPRAAVLKGRCLSYGEGITFWPLAEIVRQAAGIADEDSAEEARRKIDDLLLRAEGDIADRVASVIGLSSASFPIEESFWAARRLVEHLARSKPLVVIFDDIHWAEPTLLDWMSHVVDLAAAPILVICAARPEIRDDRPSWGKSSPRASLLDLQPLSGSDSEVLINNLLGASGVTPEIRARIIAAAQGNPLFVEQIISMWIDDSTLYRDDGSWGLRPEASGSIPPTISALLAARLDRLNHAERAVVAGASVVGQVFYRGAVEELCPPVVKPKVPTSLAVLEGKQFIRPDLSTFAEEQAFAFRHVLIRDAAYAAMLKRTRGELHERFADWMERVTGERVNEYEEIVGYHLEQAYLHSEALGRRDDRIKEIGRRAADYLSSGGKRALSRGGMSGAAKLLERAVALLPGDDEERASLLPDLAHALTGIGEFAKAESVLTDALEVSERHRYATVAAYARLERIFLRSFSDPEGAFTEGLDESERALKVFERLGDDRGAAKAWNTAAQSHAALGRMAAAQEALWRAAQHAEAADARREQVQALCWVASAARYSPTPAEKAIELCDLVLQRGKGDLIVEASVLDARCVSEAMLGHFSKARESARRAKDLYRNLGLSLFGANLGQNAGSVEMLAGEPKRAETEFRHGYVLLEEMKEKASLSTMAALLAHSLYAQGRYEEADRFTHISQEATASDDILSHILWRTARAKIAARRGLGKDGEKLAAEAVGLAEETEFLNDRGDALADLAEVLVLRGRSSEAVPTLQRALALYEQKGNIVSAAKARKLLKGLGSRTVTPDVRRQTPPHSRND